MQQELYAQARKFNRAVYSATKDLTDINVRSYERLVQEQLNIAGRCLENGVKQLEMVRDANDLAGYAAAQREQLKKCSKNLQLSAKETHKILSETSSEYNSWFKEGFSSLRSVPENEKA